LPAFAAQLAKDGGLLLKPSACAKWPLVLGKRLWPVLLSRWQRQALAEAVPSSAKREKIKRLRAELKRVKQERDSLKVVTIFA
jgi:hypothetical protein